MSYTLSFFNATVEAEITGWPPGIYAGFVRIAEQMEITGPNLGLPYTRPMGEGLFEIRARGREGIGRALFCTAAGRRIFILHCFIKKTQTTPVRDLRIARQRLKEVQHGH